MDGANAIQLLKTASGLILSQKNFAIYKEAGYEEGNKTLGALGIDTNQILGGAFSGSTEEVLNGGKLSGSLSFLSGVASFVLSTEPISANISQSSQIMQHPLEFARSEEVEADEDIVKPIQNYIVDHSIVLPTTISLEIAFPKMLYQSVHNELEKLYREKTLLVIVARSSVYRKMVIQSFTHSEEPNTIDRMIYSVQFREIQGSYPLTQVVKNPDDKGATGK